jgi:site-specific DNA-methyltransferase (adenine-specific)
MHAAKRGEMVFGAKRRIRIDGHANPPPVDFDSVDGLRDEVAAEVVRLSAGWVLLFCTPEGVAPWRDALEAAGARYKRACVWVKPDSAPQFNGQGPAMGAEMFVSAWCGSGFSRWNGGGRRNVFVYPCQPPDRTGLHPTEKPLSLMGELVRLFSNVGDVVLDPFMGIGSTGLAAIKLGRTFIGIEKDPKYFEIACKRIEDAYKQGDLFVSPPENKPEQMTLLESDRK